MNPLTPLAPPAPARRLLDAVTAADKAVAQGIPADTFLQDHFRAHRNFGAQMRRTIGDTVFAFFRWRGWLCPRDTPPHYTRATLLAFALAVTEFPPWSRDWVAMNWPPGGTPIPLAGCSRAQKQATLQASGCGACNVNDCVPAWVAALPLPEGTRFIESLQERPPIWLRFRKDDRPTGLQILADHAPCAPHPHLPNAVALTQAISRSCYDQATNTPFEFQDVSSQAVGWIAAPQPGETWWDCCAGAGGKTLHLADLMGGRGIIWATEPRTAALKAFAQRARRAGCTAMIRPQRANAWQLDPPALLDGALIDAPCSGLGTWARQPDARWRMSRDRVQSLAKRQTRLLNHVAPFIRPGGTLVYAVCTVTPEETTDQVATFADAHPAFAPASVTHPLTGEATASPIWIHPWDGPGGAMFVAKWIRSPPTAG